MSLAIEIKILVAGYNGNLCNAFILKIVYFNQQCNVANTIKKRVRISLKHRYSVYDKADKKKMLVFFALLEFPHIFMHACFRLAYHLPDFEPNANHSVTHLFISSPQ